MQKTTLLSGYRVEILRHTRADGGVSYYGHLRKRGKSREYGGYISVNDMTQRMKKRD